MSLQKILEKIEQEASQEVEAILGEAIKKADSLKKEAEARARAQAESIIKQAETEASLEASRILTQAQLQRRMELLKARREQISRVLEEALKNEELKKLRLKKEIVSREGILEEMLEADRLLAELGPEIENEILAWLKI
ncbi:MAG TPA: V-type ATP synthase subunit E family protein [Candidatus Saccharicenans sp.]|nr:V-type ATP synthase subunit E family protein [Candidatus Saccharicenans sp.]HPC88093.1 V-type ATP synthase subunit E family protein [Candidatus Saccharicenans sp.]HQE64406.1 V-type ATP synthase subunit E family protein [Candidatus Saccharicenans sp.]HQH61132.1 V-type ATP synthase subunit E family protein [Candidatus Saccharicenans sp.]HQI22418.1 V-type ATP synthase subunit E family protein [Candidatus Saccharicenans sp.]